MKMKTLPRNVILPGDALARLRDLPDASIDSIVTSPPYFRLRNYGHDDQLGLEPTVDAWVAELRAVLAECARLLVPTGTVWLNLGDSYSTHQREGAPQKSLLFGPERLALQLISDGWTIRNKVIWAKTNTVPSSVTDRFTTRHEVVYLLTRQTKYYFDLDSLRVPHTSKPPKPRASPLPKPSPRPAWLGPNGDGDAGLTRLHAAGLRGHPLGKNIGDVWQLAVSRYRGAHFATFPTTLSDRLVLAGTPRMRCPACRAPWVQHLIRTATEAHRQPPRPTCGCQQRPEPGIVLDPFIGSGTTALSARRLGRDWLGIELNPEYIALATARLNGGTSTTDNRKEVINE